MVDWIKILMFFKSEFSDEEVTDHKRYVNRQSRRTRQNAKNIQPKKEPVVYIISDSDTSERSLGSSTAESGESSESSESSEESEENEESEESEESEKSEDGQEEHDDNNESIDIRKDGDSSFEDSSSDETNDDIDIVQYESLVNDVIGYFQSKEQPEIHDVFSLCSELPKEIQKYTNLLLDFNIEFTKDLPLHLYSVYLLSTRNRNVPPPGFSNWPLQTQDLITPRNAIKTTDFQSLGQQARAFRVKMNWTRYTKINFSENNLLHKPKLRMLEFWHPEINATDELNECMDAIFEKRINKQIEQYSEENRYDKHGLPSRYRYQRHTPEDIRMDPILRNNIKTKLDNIIDRMVESYQTGLLTNESLGRKLAAKVYKPPEYGLNWLNVLTNIDQKDKKARMHLLMLFNLKLEKDILSGPINTYSSSFEPFANAQIYKDKVLKGIAIKRKRAAVPYSTNLKNMNRVTKKQKSHIRYNLDDFLNLSLPSKEQKQR